MKQSLTTAERVRELFEYDAELGVLRWRIRQGNRAKVGGIAGTRNKISGRMIVCVDGVQFLSYRVIWLHVYGAWPTGEIDHIDGDPSNDRLENLRDVSARVNCENKRSARSDKRFGSSLGAYPSDGGRWRAQIVVRGKAIHLGCFGTESEAHHAYIEAKRKLHDGCTL